MADFCRSRPTPCAGQIPCKQLVKSNANGWSVAMQTGGQVECNSPRVSVQDLYCFCFCFCNAIVQTTRKPITEGRTQVLLWGWRGRTPRQPRWAMDGPSRRAHGSEPERGNLSGAKAVRWGEDFLVPFWSFKKGLDVKSKP